MLTAIEGDSQLGSHAVRRRDQYRIAEAGRLQIEQPAEPAQRRIRTGAGGHSRQGLYRFDESISGVDIDARIAVRKSVICHFLRYGFLLGQRGIQRAQKILYPGGFAMLLRRVRSGPRAVSRQCAVQEICVDA